MKLREFDKAKDGEGWDLRGDREHPVLIGNLKVECPIDEAEGIALVDLDGLTIHIIDEEGEDIISPLHLDLDYFSARLLAENLGETFYIRPDWDQAEREFYGEEEEERKEEAYTEWICRRCGQEVISKGRPEPIRWTDGHVCSFSPREE